MGSLRSVIWRFWDDTPLNSPWTWCWPTRPPCPTASPSPTPQNGSVPRSSWRRWPHPTAFRFMIRSCWPPRTTVFFGCMEGSAHGDDASGEGRNLSASRNPDLLQEGRSLGDSSVRGWAAPGERPDCDRGGAGHRDGGAPASKRDILEIFGHSSELIVMAPGGLRRGSRYVVRVVAGGDQLARQTGLVDGRGRPIRGLPRRWSRGPPAMPRPPGAGPSWPTARSPSRGAPPHWR